MAHVAPGGGDGFEVVAGVASVFAGGLGSGPFYPEVFEEGCGNILRIAAFPTQLPYYNEDNCNGYDHAYADCSDL